MKFDFCTKGKLKIDMSKYMKKMVDNFKKLYVLKNLAILLASNDLFGNNDKSPKLDDKLQEQFHTCVAHGLFACKRWQPDTVTAILVLSMRACSPSVDNWHKLLQYMQ